MKHRQYILGLTLLFLLLFCGGCSNNFMLTDTEEASQVKVIRLATDLTEKSLAYQQLEEFARQLAELSEGKWQIVLYPEGEWGSTESMLDYLYLGSLDMLCLSTEALTLVDEAFAIYQQPLLFTDEVAVQQYLDGQQGVEALALLGEKYQPLGWAENGYLYLLETVESGAWYSLVELEKMVQLKNIPLESRLYDEAVYYQLEGVFCREKWWSECNEAEQKLIQEAFKAAQEISRAQRDALVAERLAPAGLLLETLPPEMSTIYQAQWLAMQEEYFARHSDTLTQQWRPVVVTEIVLGK